MTLIVYGIVAVWIMSCLNIDQLIAIVWLTKPTRSRPVVAALIVHGIVAACVVPGEISVREIAME